MKRWIFASLMLYPPRQRRHHRDARDPIHKAHRQFQQEQQDTSEDGWGQNAWGHFHSSTTGSDMALGLEKSMHQLDRDTRCPDTWLNEYVSVGMFLDETDTWMDSLSKADHPPPQCGWASSSLSKAWIQQRGRREGLISAWLRELRHLSSPPLTLEFTPWAPLGLQPADDGFGTSQPP